MNPRLDALRPYPFERLENLVQGVQAPRDRKLLKLSVGEPQHAPPPAVVEALRDNLDLLAHYPATRGSDALRESQAAWLMRRHALRAVDPATQVLPVNGTREALFAIAQAAIDSRRDALVGIPNPFYPIYEGAARLAGARTALFDTTPESGFLPDPQALPDSDWQRLQLLYLCSPGNPGGAVMDHDLLRRFIDKALRHDVLLVSDECYSEIYPDDERPPPGLLAACAAMGVDDFRNCLSMHSLSKRSNLPGLRSGFVAGDAARLAAFLRYRSYHGSAMPPHHQLASAIAWNDESHVLENRRRYREKFAAVHARLHDKLALNRPEGGFYFWAGTPLDDETFTRRLYREAGVLVLPGRYLGRASERGNPGAGRVRMALVAELPDCIDAAERIASFVERL